MVIMIKEKSAGAIIFRKNSKKNYFLLLNYPSGHWDFVKGKIEKDEAPKNTTLRETKEETGISDLQFINGFEEKIEYDFQYDNNLIHKEVIFFLAKTNTEQINLSHEHLDYIWSDYENTIKKITYDNSRKILIKAKKYLNDV